MVAGRGRGLLIGELRGDLRIQNRIRGGDHRYRFVARRRWAYAEAACRRLRVACPGPRLPSLFHLPSRKGYGDIRLRATNAKLNCNVGLCR